MLLTLCMVMSLFAGTTVTASAAEDTAPTGCTHQHDESCGYAEAVAEVPCDKDCTDTDGDGVTDHAEDCAYTPAVEGQPCNHVYDENCGGLTADPGVQYEEIAIAKNSLNGNAILGVTESTSGVAMDDFAYFYSESKALTGGLPNNGKLNMPSGISYTLAAGEDSAAAYNGNDCIRLTASKTSQMMSLETVGVYQNVYVLATAGGPGTGHYADFTVTLTYTDGSTADTEFKLYDWYDTTTVPGVEKYYNVKRIQIGSTSPEGSEIGGPVLHSAKIEVDTQKLLKQITFTMKGKDGDSNNKNGLYCCIFAVTGATPAGAPEAPVATAATKTAEDTFIAHWESVNDATSYRLDVATDRKFTNILNDYNNKYVENVTSVKVVGSDILPNTTYYYRVRAVNNSGQSLSSNRISTDLPIWLKNALEDTDLNKVTYNAETNTVTFGSNVALKDTIMQPTDDTTVIDLGGSTVTAPAGKSAISGSGNNVEFSIASGESSKTPGSIVGSGTDSIGNGVPVIDFSNATGSSKIAVTGGTVSGGNGTNGTNGGSGGAGIAASDSTQVEVGSGATVTGGNGGDATSGTGGSGGAGISGGSVNVSSGGTVTGGNGGDATGENGTGGDGGAGIAASSRPSNNGTVTGGNGGNGAGGGGTGGSAGASGGTNGISGSAHVHSWVYAANGSIVTATCSVNSAPCQYHTDSVTLTLTATNANYSGSPYTGASVTNNITAVTAAAAGDITYEGVSPTSYTKSTTAPTNAGTYKATVTIGGATAEQTFTITPKGVTPVVTMANYAFGSTPSTPVISANGSNGTVTVYYSTYSDIATNPDHRIVWHGTTETPLQAGTYYMVAHVAGTHNFTEGTTALITFKVTPSSYAAPTAPTVSGFTVTVNEADREKKLEYAVVTQGSPVPTSYVSVPTLNSSGSFDLTGLAENTRYTVYLRQKASADGNYAASDSVSADFTTPTQYSVAYNANYGTGTVPSSVTQNSGSSVTVASGSGLRRTGYTFRGWNTKADRSGTAYAAGATIKTGATLYAQWTPNTYTVKFNANGGTGTMKDQSLTYDAAATALRTNSFTKTGYHFAGWATSAGGAVIYSDQQSVKNLASGGSVNLYAVWVQNVYGGSGGSSSGNSSTISTPSAKNGTVSVSPKSASKGTTVTVTVTPDKGYVLETLTVTDASGKKLDLKNLGSGKYSFTMPASKVEVKATFMEDNTMLNYFVDVPASAYYYDAVLWAAEQGITGGTDATHFSPDGVCTRAQAVTFLWRAAGSPAPSATAMPFTDVAADSYYYNAVLWAMENGITVGTSSTTFSPDLNCSRAHIMTFLWRSEKSPAAGSVNPFTDVSADAYYADAVLWAVKESVTNGTSSATFSPDADCTRAQIVTFIWRTLAR